VSIIRVTKDQLSRAKAKVAYDNIGNTFFLFFSLHKHWSRLLLQNTEKSGATREQMLESDFAKI